MKKREIPHKIKILWIILGVLLLGIFGMSIYLMNSITSTEKVVLISNFYIISMYLLIPYFIITLVYLSIESVKKFQDIKKTIAKYPSQTQ